MAISRLSGIAFSLIVIFLTISCGGVGVSSRNALKNPRSANEHERAVSENADAESADVRRADTSSRVAAVDGRSTASMEAFFEPWLNAPYLLGGEDFNGVDCSGLVTRFFSDYYNMDVPRTTETQYSGSISIPEGKEQAGDLIFFQNTYRPGISHVGIYLGDGRFVHAANSGVEINDMDDSYYNSRFVGFRRFSK